MQPPGSIQKKAILLRNRPRAAQQMLQRGKFATVRMATVQRLIQLLRITQQYDALRGLRAVAYVEGGTCRLVSRNHNAFKTFQPLAAAISALPLAPASWRTPKTHRSQRGALPTPECWTKQSSRQSSLASSTRRA
jgi:hypothetical protein